MDSENSLRAKHLARLYGRFLRASQKHDHYHIAAYADDPRLQDLLECRVHRHSWDAFDLSGREPPRACFFLDDTFALLMTLTYLVSGYILGTTLPFTALAVNSTQLVL